MNGLTLTKLFDVRQCAVCPIQSSVCCDCGKAMWYVFGSGEYIRADSGSWYCKPCFEKASGQTRRIDDQTIVGPSFIETTYGDGSVVMITY